MLIYDAVNLPEGAAFIEQWQHLACKNGLPGIQFVAHLFWRTSAYDPWPLGFDAVTVSGLSLIMTYSKLEIELARLKRASANGSAATSLGGAGQGDAQRLLRKSPEPFAPLLWSPRCSFRIRRRCLFSVG